MPEENRYSRNYLYINDREQFQISQCRILLGGAGLGSVIAECVLRMGFKNILIIDGDRIELSNINRQNYTIDDIGKYKAKALYDRLKSIDNEADIKYKVAFLNEHNISEYLQDIDIAINAIDFTSKAPFVFDALCLSQNIPVLHPYNLGWAGLVFVLNKQTDLSSLITTDNFKNYEVSIISYILNDIKSQNIDVKWLEDILLLYENQVVKTSPPQLSVGSYLVAGMCSKIMFDICSNKKIKTFPNYYFSTY